MDAGGGSAKLCCLIAVLPIEIGVAPRQQFLDPALLVARADGVKRPSRVFLRIGAVEPTGFDQRCGDGPVTRGALVAGEQGVLAGRSHRPDGPLKGIVVEGFAYRRPVVNPKRRDSSFAENALGTALTIVCHHTLWIGGWMVC